MRQSIQENDEVNFVEESISKILIHLYSLNTYRAEYSRINKVKFVERGL